MRSIGQDEFECDLLSPDPEGKECAVCGGYMDTHEDIAGLHSGQLDVLTWRLLKQAPLLLVHEKCFWEHWQKAGPVVKSPSRRTGGPTGVPHLE